MMGSKHEKQGEADKGMSTVVDNLSSPLDRGISAIIDNPSAVPDNPLTSWESKYEEQLPVRPSRLSKLALPTALLVGAAITAGTTYTLVCRVQHLIATAAVDPDPETWKRAAREDVYDPCYLGCSDCRDPSYAWNACQRTVDLFGAANGVCNANRMWNWKERYPEGCLAAMGEVLKAEALARLRQTYRNQLAIIILTVLGGVVGAWISHALIRKWANFREKRATRRRRRRQRWPGFWKPERFRRREKQPSAGTGRLKAFLVGVLVLFGRKTDAYACTGRDPTWDQFFINPNGTIAGVVHGWFSNCYDRTYCYQTCTVSCTGTSATGSPVCTQSCTTSCYTVTYTDKSPREFVDNVVPKVKACGFMPADTVPVVIATRIANAKIERDYWVRISVNGLNITKSDETDEGVLCLHGIADN